MEVPAREGNTDRDSCCRNQENQLAQHVRSANGRNDRQGNDAQSEEQDWVMEYVQRVAVAPEETQQGRIKYPSGDSVTRRCKGEDQDGAEEAGEQRVADGRHNGVRSDKPFPQDEDAKKGNAQHGRGWQGQAGYRIETSRSPGRNSKVGAN